MMLIARVETDINWINDFAETRVVGHLFLFNVLFGDGVIGASNDDIWVDADAAQLARAVLGGFGL